MATIQTLGELEALQPVATPFSYSGASHSVALYDQRLSDYAALYRSQPWVRICVDFFARNTAQLTIHGFRKVTQTDRRNEDAHPVVRLLHRPNPWTTHYRMLRGLTSDRKIYDRAFLLKVIPPGTSQPRALIRIPPTAVEVAGALWPKGYRFTFGNRMWTAPPEDVLVFHGYSPETNTDGLSTLETLRRTLAEEDASMKHREALWRRGAKIGGVVERPVEAPEWTPEAMETFRSDFERFYGGLAGAGKVPVLEEGMTFRPVDFSAEASQYIAARKLNREEVGAAFHIQLSQIQILEHATLTNVREQHKALYQDTLGPDLEEVAQDLELQLLPDFADVADVYLEFNLREKLRGSFDEEASSISTAVGAPWMLRSEGRALFDLPEIPGADTLVVPLNVLEGGQASPQDSVPPKGAELVELVALSIVKGFELAGRPLELEPAPAPATKADGKARGWVGTHMPALRSRHAAAWQGVIRNHFERQRKAIDKLLNRKAPAPAEVVDAMDDPRWDRELADDLYRMNVATATVWAKHVAEQLGTEVDVARLEPWLKINAEKSAPSINDHTRERVAAAAGFGVAGTELDPDEIRHVFEIALASRAAQIAVTRVTAASMFGAHSGAEQAGARTKRWVVNSAHPRAAHRQLNGETVALGETFSNGMKWPGDPAGGADNNAHCECTVEFGNGED